MIGKTRLLVPLAAILLLVPAACTGGGNDETVRVYSGRHYGEEETFREFSRETGIDVEFLFGSDAELRERIRAEGVDGNRGMWVTDPDGNRIEIMEMAPDCAQYEAIKAMRNGGPPQSLVRPI